VEGSLREIQYAYDVLKVDGIGLFTNTGAKWLGDPTYAPIFNELNRRGAVIFLHPVVADCCGNLAVGVPPDMVEVDFDTTRAVASLLDNGILSSCPSIRFIINHSGAAVPTLAGRIKDRVPKKDAEKLVPRGALYELQKLYYEVAHATYPWPMAALMKFVPPTQILFGTDFPIEPYETTLNPLSELALSEETLEQIYRGTAEHLFPRLKA
jgi:predicted TIM-barrel fold metal-dependent hydrolase